jgi:hypothetical protein
MMKKQFPWRSQLSIKHYASSIGIYALCILMLSGLSMSISSCKDDDDDKNSSELRNDDADPLDTDEAETAWRWLSVLTSTETLTNDWSKKTYEPTVGVPSENNANTRIVVVTSLDEAKTKFASLAGVSADLLGGEYTAKQSGVGKLVWTPSKAGAQNLAEVAVDTKLIPKLQKIVYCTHDQVGDNANVTGTAFYRLGDVVEDKDGYYWVCVRPSFQQGDKGKSHWMNIYNASETGRSTKGNTMPMLKANIYDKYDNKEKYGNHTILLPTQLKYSREHLYNLSNLIYALLHPADYAKKAGTGEELHNNGLCGFDYKYHGENFLQTVAYYWDKPTPNGFTVWQLLFNRKREDMEPMTSLKFLYKGYQWRTGRWGYVWKYEAKWDDRHKAVAPGEEDDDKLRTEFADEGFDVRRYCSTPGAENSNTTCPAQFSKTVGTWVVRYKTGADLMDKGDYSPYEHLNNCTDIYRYNEKTGMETHNDLVTDKSIEVPGDALDEPKVGCLIGADGKFYANKTIATRCKTEPVAMVVYLGGDTRVQEGRDWNGLAIALKDVEKDGNKKFAWNSENAQKVCCSTSVTLASCASLRLDGFIQTIALKDHNCDKDHKHPAAEVAWGASPAPGCSQWFLPSIGQWFLAGTGMGFKYDFESDATYGKIVKQGKWLFKEAGVPEAELGSSGYWSTTESEGRLVWEFNIEASPLYKDITTCPVRQMTAFTYGNGASKDPESPIRPLKDPVVKSLIGKDGQFYSNKNDAINSTGYYPVAVVAYVGDKGTAETNTQYRGLAISLQSPAKQSWITEEKDQICTVKTESLSQYYEGLKWTKFLSEGCGGLKHDHVASFCYSREYGFDEGIREKKGFSNWFIPTTAQWLLIFEKGLGMKWNKEKKQFDNNPAENYKLVKELYTSAGLEENVPNGYVWTVSEQDAKNCYVVYIAPDKVILYNGYPKEEFAYTVPVVAF